MRVTRQSYQSIVLSLSHVTVGVGPSHRADMMGPGTGAIYQCDHSVFCPSYKHKTQSSKTVFTGARPHFPLLEQKYQLTGLLGKGGCQGSQSGPGVRTASHGHTHSHAHLRRDPAHHLDLSAYFIPMLGLLLAGLWRAGWDL